MLRQAAPLRTQAVDAIRAHIVDLTYEPGVRLKEKDLCAKYDVSRTVIREALRQLESEHLVRIEPQVGPVVVTLTRTDVRNLYEARAALESAAGQIAAERASAEQLDRLEELYAEIARFDGELDELIALKNRFYRALIEASGNTVLGHMLDNVQSRISQLRRITLGSPSRRPEMVREVGDVVEAIRARDPEAAYTACMTHVRLAAEVALNGFEDESSTAESARKSRPRPANTTKRRTAPDD